MLAKVEAIITEEGGVRKKEYMSEYCIQTFVSAFFHIQKKEEY